MSGMSKRTSDSLSQIKDYLVKNWGEGADEHVRGSTLDDVCRKFGTTPKTLMRYGLIEPNEERNNTTEKMTLEEVVQELNDFEEDYAHEYGGDEYIEYFLEGGTIFRNTQRSGDDAFYRLKF